MKIAVVSFHFPPLDIIGSGIQMHMLASEYAKSGHSVTVVSASSMCPKDALYDFRSAKITGNAKLFRWLSFVLRQDWSEFDVVHAGGDGQVFNRSAKIIVRTLLGSSLQESRNQQSTHAMIRMKYLYILEQLAVAQSHVVTSISPETNRDFRRSIAVVPCGIDLDLFKVGGIKSCTPSILFVGIVNSRKRGRLLVDVFEKQVERNIPNAVLNVVRDTNPINNTSIAVHGVVSIQDLVMHYQSNWVMVLPSSYEGFGLPYVESMACGTPVIATSNPGSTFVLGDGKHGVISSDDKLGDAICALLGDSDLRAQFRCAGLDRAQDFDITKIAKVYLELTTRL